MTKELKDYVNELVEAADEINEKIKKKTEKSQHQQRQQYNKKAHSVSDINAGDEVMIANKVNTVGKHVTGFHEKKNGP